MKRLQLSLILKIAARGYTLAKYLKDSGIGSGSVPVQGLIGEIMDLREHAASLRQHAERKPIAQALDLDHVAPDVTIHLKRDGGHTVEPPTGFDIVEKK